MITEQIIQKAISEMFSGIEFPKEPSGLYDPLGYMISIGGKRIRPVLCLTAYALFKDELGPEIIEPARALEVFHSFTLIHDDIMDRSPLRRGQQTVWKKWNEDTAILSGDVMLIDSYDRICRGASAAHAEVMALFSKTASQVCEGQQYDMEFENETMVGMERYEQMIGLKTAVLLACSAKMGGLIAGASEDDCNALYNYGYQLGMAFQVADDYLDTFGDEKVFGKPIGGDIINNKKSWLLVRAFEKAADTAELEAAMAMSSSTKQESDAKITAVREIYKSLRVDEDARIEILRYSDNALDALRPMKLDVAQFDLLRNFEEKLIGRAK